MIKFATLLLSNLILLQSINIDVNTFTKVKVLLEHAHYHQEKYGDNFIEFITEHYVENEFLTTNHHKEHKNLPFKQNSQNLNNILFDFSFYKPSIQVKDKVTLYLKPRYFYKEPHSIFEKKAVFQPPKYA